MFTCLFVLPLELTLNLLHNKLINLHPYKVSLVNSLAQHFLPADCHDASMALWSHSTKTSLCPMGPPHHVPCTSIKHILRARLHLWLTLLYFLVLSTNIGRAYTNQNSVNYSVYVFETSLSLGPFLFCSAANDLNIFSPTIVSQTNKIKGTNEYLELIYNGIASYLTRQLAASLMGDNWTRFGENRGSHLSRLPFSG